MTPSFWILKMTAATMMCRVFRHIFAVAVLGILDQPAYSVVGIFRRLHFGYRNA
tara:strand:- start:21 stop:182 length:162 start_codon:yes stop_codon:yes gene_type:complete